ncbi:MAG: hypothetical protein ACTSRS_00930 [Candidatus Helarchaeota archaeon]
MRTFSEIPFRVLIIKEADQLSMDIQQALRRTLEKSSRTCRFFLICENLSKIIEPIRSRFVVLNFKPLQKPEITAILRYIITTENISIDDEALAAIIFLGRRNMIRTINFLQMVATAYNGQHITADLVSKVSQQLIIFRIRNMLLHALNRDFSAARKFLRELFIQFGLTGSQIIEYIRQTLTKLHIPENWKVSIFDLLGDYDLRLRKGANEEIQLSAFLTRLAVLNLT